MKNLIAKHRVIIFISTMIVALFIFNCVKQWNEIIQKDKSIHQLRAELTLKQQTIVGNKKKKTMKLILSNAVEFLMVSAKQQGLLISSLHPLKPEIIQQIQIVRVQLTAIGYCKEWLKFVNSFSRYGSFILLRDFSLHITAQKKLQIEAELWVTNIPQMPNTNLNFNPEKMRDPFYKTLRLTNYLS